MYLYIYIVFNFKVEEELLLELAPSECLPCHVHVYPR